MYHPVSVIEGNPYPAIGVSPFLAHGPNTVMDPTDHKDNLKMKSKFHLDGIATIPVHPDSTAISTPVVNSVWLEQGEYFFDDEFAVSYDTNLVDPCIENPCMTQSLAVDPSATHDALPLDQSRSDSCIFTPGDSGESGLASAQTEHTQSSGENNALRMNTKGTKGKTKASLGTNMKMNTELINGIVSDVGARVSNDPPVCVDGVNMDTMAQNGLPNGNSVSGSQGSGQSGSTSWMQMIMERSCNPDLKALLSRTAAAVDYKLAYGETFPADSSMISSVQHLLQGKCPMLYTAGTCGLSRSLSQGNLLTVAGLAGLRHALDQTAQYLPAGVAPQVRSVGVTAELTSGGNSGAATGTSSCADVNTSNTTTWAQKHGSRESLKRKVKRSNDVFVIPPASDPPATKAKETNNPWREMKKASGTLITWNQLKRTIKGNQAGLERTATFRESRKEQHINSNVKNVHNSDGDPSSNTPIENGATVRSRSQPVSSGHYMHRFSGTLLEIFMRAKAEEMTFLNLGEDNGVGQGHANSSNQNYDSSLNGPTDDNKNRRKLLTFPSPGRRTSDTVADLAGSRSESDKHPLLRGNRILPQKWHPNSPTTPSADPKTDQKFVCSFGVQFPPPSSEIGAAPCNGPSPNSSQSPNCTSPIWSNGLPVRRSNAAVRGTRYPVGRHSHPRNPCLPGRPQSFAHNKPVFTTRCLQEQAFERQSSSGAPSAIATCLTASAGPDSPYMAALRADYVADGYSVGWLGNPRASIAYPGLGLLSIPRPSRLTSASFLSHTLPDLSFLTQAAEEEERKGTPTMPKRLTACRCLSRDKAEHCCARCGCRSLSVGRAQRCKHKQHRTSCKSARPSENDTPAGSSEFDEDQATKMHIRSQRPRTSDPPPVIPDLVMGHKGSMQPSTEDGNHEDSTGQHNQFMNMSHVDRSTSEPDLNAAVLNSVGQNAESVSTTDGSYARPSALMTSSTQECYGWDSYKNADDEGLFTFGNRPKKSVSFSGKIRSLRLHGFADKDEHEHSPASPEPRLIPRNWGLYGQETPLAEFNPRNSPGRDTVHGTEPAQQSDLDIRYHAMVNDVIKAVQEMVAYLTNAAGSGTLGRQRNGRQVHEPLPFSVVAALGSTGHQPVLSVIGPLTVLLSDGLLPPAKPFFTPRPRTRLWQMVEDSCRPSPHLTGVTYCILNDAVSQVKALTNVTLERAKFKAFLCACLNVKALPLWLNAVIANETLLRRFYCEDAFVRQCRSSQRGLHADLMTHLEQLLAFPFELDLAVEARKPLIDPTAVPKPSVTPGEPNGTKHQQSGGNKNSSNNNNNTHSSGNSNNNNGTGDHNASAVAGEGPLSAGQLAKVTARPSIPPSIVTKRKQLISTQGAVPNRARFSPSPVPPVSSVQNPTIHHYPQHHLPGQRITTAPTRLGAPSRLSRPGNQRHSEESGASSASSEPRASAETTKISQPRSSTSAGSNHTTGSIPPARGRFKSALSTFRRTTPMVTNLSPSKASNNPNNNGTSPVTLANSQPEKPNGMDAAPLTTNSSAQNVPKIASKLKQPSTIVGRR